MRRVEAFLIAVAVMAVAGSSFAEKPYREQVEADWLLQEKMRWERKGQVTTVSDAAGVCDGVKDGKWGCHTGMEDSPWWQVDLRAQHALARVAIWNRCDGAAPRSNHLAVLLSDDGQSWRTVYKHNGTTFYGFTDKKPLVVSLEGRKARFVRIQLPGKTFLHLDEVQVFGAENSKRNLAFRCPTNQSSVSQWSTYDLAPPTTDWADRILGIAANCDRLAAEGRGSDRLLGKLETVAGKKPGKQRYLEARWIQREMLLSDPLMDMGSILFAKRVPGSYNHMSDQYYGWWSRPGGGLFTLENFKTGNPTASRINAPLDEAGSFLRPMLSYDGSTVLFSWCRHYPDLASEKDKLNKANVPEDAFYHVFEMNVDGTGLRQLTQGKYDDFDARYLPDGRIVFLSTRRGQSIQCGVGSAAASLARNDQPDVYVRCGGGPERPVAVYTLHTIDGDGGNLCAISPFEMFEWTPTVARDGSIMYSRWDYVDRHNMPYMSLWAMNPDGTNSRVVYGNYTKAPHCTFEARSIPNSQKIVFTASAHHAQTMGSLVLLDPAASTEGTSPITRLTPEVPFPEIEAWPTTAFANPWPLSERLYLVSWGATRSVHEGGNMPPNAMGLYVFDSQSGQLELVYRDPKISSAWPVPLRSRPTPPVVASQIEPDAPNEGQFLLLDVYRGLKTVKRGDIKSLRIVAIPAKTHPTMNAPIMGVTKDDPGKCVLGTVPVEPNGSANFRVPAGVTLFFQALDENGMAVQTMRGATHVQPGQTLSCVGCHESRHSAPAGIPVHAASREPSPITVGPPGSWPLRFDRLVQPVLDQNCVKCHNPEGKNPVAAKFDLTGDKAYDSLVRYGSPSLFDHVMARYMEGYSTEGACAARTSALLAKVAGPKGHHGVKLDAAARERLITWMDTYAQRLGSFSEQQERELIEFRDRIEPLLIERGTKQVASVKN